MPMSLGSPLGVASILRRDLQRQAETPQHKEVLKGTRWLLKKNPENLNPDRDEKRRSPQRMSVSSASITECNSTCPMPASPAA